MADWAHWTHWVGATVGAGWLTVALLLAVWIDRRFGEPPVAWHPVVWMGAYLARAGPLVRRLPPEQAFLAGALAWILGAALTAVLAAGLQRLCASAPAWLGPLGLVLMAWSLKSLFAWSMLRNETRAVEQALAQSVASGRARLARLVSRDTSALSATQVRESAIESLAENLNDSVVAPLFWFVCLGLPGAAVYRFANTADAMWGYRGEWEWAGKWAARADDVLSWPSARLTAVLLAWCGRLADWGELPTEARKTASPNSGWPMAAMALSLGVRLRKPGVYSLNPGGRDAAVADTERAIGIARGAVRCALLLALVSLLGRALLQLMAG